MLKWKKGELGQTIPKSSAKTIINFGLFCTAIAELRGVELGRGNYPSNVVCLT